MTWIVHIDVYDRHDVYLYMIWITCYMMDDLDFSN